MGNEGSITMSPEDPVGEKVGASSARANVNERTVKGMIIGETLGKGTFGYVKLGIHKATKQKFAMKFLKRNTPKFKEDVVQKEIDCMKKVRHANVVWLVGARLCVNYPRADGTTEPTVLMVMEYCDAGDLYDVIYYAGALNEKLGRTYFKQIIEGLQAIHAAGITHRDLKPNNILIGGDFQLKITDFGLSHIGDEAEDPSEKRMNTVWVGTRGYRAPELVLGRHYSNAADVFALGVCLFVMLCARQPFKTAASTDAWYKCIASQQYKKYWKSHKNNTLSPEAKDMLQQLLCYQPRQRITLENALKHPWMRKSSMYSKKELISVMQRLHARSCQKKMADPSRAERLQLSEAGNKTTRAIHPDDPNSRFKGVEVKTVDRISPAWACYEVKQDPECPPHVVMEEGLQWVEGEHQKGKVEIENKEDFTAAVTMAGVDGTTGNFTTKFHVKLVKRTDVKKAFLHLKESEYKAFVAGLKDENSESVISEDGTVVKSPVHKFPVGSKILSINDEPFTVEQFCAIENIEEASFTVQQDEALVLCMWLDNEAKNLEKVDVLGAQCFDNFFGAVQGFCAGPFVEAFEVGVQEYPENLAELLGDVFETEEMNDNLRADTKEEEVGEAVPVLPDVAEA